jgi:hypothetical protein
MESTTSYTPGTVVLASDGMSTWDRALVVSGPHQRLTSDHALYLIRFLEDSDEYLAHPAELRVGA